MLSALPFSITGDTDGTGHKHGSLSDGNVANGNWNPDNRKVRFNWNNPDNRNSNNGARVEISRRESSF